MYGGADGVMLGSNIAVEEKLSVSCRRGLRCDIQRGWMKYNIPK